MPSYLLPTTVLPSRVHSEGREAGVNEHSPPFPHSTCTKHISQPRELKEKHWKVALVINRWLLMQSTLPQLTVGITAWEGDSLLHS